MNYVSFIHTSSSMFFMRWIFIFAAPPLADSKDIIFWSSFAMNVVSRLTVVILLNSWFICIKKNEGADKKKAQLVNVENWLQNSAYCKSFSEKIFTWTASKRAGRSSVFQVIDWWCLIDNFLPANGECFCHFFTDDLTVVPLPYFIKELHSFMFQTFFCFSLWVRG